MKVTLALLLILAAFTTALNTKTHNTKEETLKYWTRERFLNAREIPLLKLTKEQQQKQVKKSKSLPFLLSELMEKPTTTTNKPMRIKKFSIASTTEVPHSLYNSQPYRQAGKLFAVDPNGHLSTCSASSVGKGVVITAGHCISDGKGNFFSRIVFCPQYYDGYCNKGRFSATYITIFDDYHNNGNMGRDVAFLNTSPNERGQTVDEVVGAYKLLVNVGRDNDVIVLGYPGNIARGERMIQSRGTQSLGHSFFQPATTKVPSTMTQGASGGPTAVANTYVNGVNSYITSADPNNIFTPYFDSEVQRFYEIALNNA